ncbi:helix-turn-helix domain-containing protein [Roseicyclus sp.]|uniref:helix-turn-helix domain-containing protein n=1 Tax=Roseicyclus sp. TaxID=1914329 RepID=UPI003F6BE1C8
MSHRAVNWALDQRHLKPGPWIVLLQLCDRHNKDTKQVNPEQATLAFDCNMSRATVNRHLDELEAMGLIQRVPRQHPVTKRQLSTFYILGLDFDAPPQIEHAVSQNETRIEQGQNENIDQSRVSNCDTGAVSQKTQKPCLKNGKSRVSNCDTNHVREPVREPCVSQGDPHTQFFDEIWDRFSAAFPRMGNVELTEERLRSAIEAGADPEHILAAARAYADEQRGNKSQYIAFSENWLDRKGWERFPKPGRPAADFTAVAVQRARAIRAGQSWVARHLSPAAARDLVARGLVTADECKAAGVTL